jgi:hypothetical protein
VSSDSAVKLPSERDVENRIRKTPILSDLIPANAHEIVVNKLLSVEQPHQSLMIEFALQFFGGKILLLGHLTKILTSQTHLLRKTD